MPKATTAGRPGSPSASRGPKRGGARPPTSARCASPARLKLAPALHLPPRPTGGSGPSGSAAADLRSARARLEADAVEVLTRQKAELEVECDRLAAEVDRKAESFKLAWQEERAAHQRDLEASAVARRAADDETRRLSESLHAAQTALQEQKHAAHVETARLRDACERAHEHLEDVRRRGNSQLRSLKNQLARVRAEKGALCEEFAAKLEHLTHQRAPSTSGHASGGAPSSAAVVDGESVERGAWSSSAFSGAVVPLSAVSALPGYEALSCFQDPTGAAAQQLHSAMSAGLAGVSSNGALAHGGAAPPSEAASLYGDGRAHERGSLHGSSTAVGSVYGGSVYGGSVAGGSVAGGSGLADGDGRAPIDAVSSPKLEAKPIPEPSPYPHPHPLPDAPPSPSPSPSPSP